MWAQILARLQVGADAQAVDGQGRWAVSVDSTIARAHQHAAGARRAPAADLAGDLAGDPAGTEAAALAELASDSAGPVTGG